MSSLETKITEIGQLNEKLANITATIEFVMQEPATAHKLLVLRGGLDDLNVHMGRNNPICGGLPECENETWDYTEQLVTPFFDWNEKQKQPTPTSLAYVQHARECAFGRLAVSSCWRSKHE